MNKLYTEENMQIVNDLLSNQAFREIVEEECGKPVKANFDWENDYFEIAERRINETKTQAD